MPKFFFHLRDGTDEMLDHEGVSVPLEAVTGAALLQARDCIAGDVKSGRLDLHYRIDVQDEAGRVVHTVKFVDALEIAPAR
jgi:hypothetical protein